MADNDDDDPIEQIRAENDELRERNGELERVNEDQRNRIAELEALLAVAQARVVERDATILELRDEVGGWLQLFTTEEEAHEQTRDQVDQLRAALRRARFGLEQTEPTWFRHVAHYVNIGNAEGMAWPDLFDLSARESNMARHPGKVHPDLHLVQLTPDEEAEKLATPPPPPTPAPQIPPAKGNYRGFERLVEDAPDALLRILRELLVFPGEVVHAISRLDPYRAPDGITGDPDDARPGYLRRLPQGRLELPRRLHVGKTSVSLTFADHPRKLLYLLQGRFAKGIGNRIQRLQHIELLWVGSQVITNPYGPKGHRSSKRLDPVRYLPKAIRLKTGGIHLQESSKKVMRRPHEPRRVIAYMKEQTAAQPNYRCNRALRNLQGLDYFHCLRGMDGIKFFDYDKCIDGQGRVLVRDYGFAVDVNESVHLPKEDGRVVDALIRNLARVPRGYAPSPEEYEAVERALDDRFYYHPFFVPQAADPDVHMFSGSEDDLDSSDSESDSDSEDGDDDSESDGVGGDDDASDGLNHGMADLDVADPNGTPDTSVHDEEEDVPEADDEEPMFVDSDEHDLSDANEDEDAGAAGPIIIEDDDDDVPDADEDVDVGAPEFDDDLGNVSGSDSSGDNSELEDDNDSDSDDDDDNDNDEPGVGVDFAPSQPTSPFQGLHPTQTTVEEALFVDDNHEPPPTSPPAGSGGNDPQTPRPNQNGPHEEQSMFVSPGSDEGSNRFNFSPLSDGGPAPDDTDGHPGSSTSRSTTSRSPTIKTSPHTSPERDGGLPPSRSSQSPSAGPETPHSTPATSPGRPLLSPRSRLGGSTMGSIDAILHTPGTSNEESPYFAHTTTPGRSPSRSTSPGKRRMAQGEPGGPREGSPSKRLRSVTPDDPFSDDDDERASQVSSARSSPARSPGPKVEDTAFDWNFDINNSRDGKSMESAINLDDD